ncbi:MAG: hypothetical protein KKA42_12805, partial [candidate division Zixibacteria bacterium]|nr:hypothetical protein [candidate division Zixibacteria bacterium]
MMRKLNSQKGGALLISLLLIGMLALLGTLAVENATTDVDLSYNQSHCEEAFYIAEAGARRAVAELQNTPGWDSGYAGLSLGGGTYDVSVTDSSANPALDDTVIIVSTGTTFGGNSTIELTIVPEESRPFRYAMFADNTVDIRNGMVTDSYCSDSGGYALTNVTSGGDVGSNGIIGVKNGALVGGDVMTSLDGGLDIHSSATVTGDTSSTAPEQELEEIPAAEYAWAEATSIAGTGITGSYSYDPATDAFISSGTAVLSSGVYFFSSVILKNSASLQVAPGASVTIYVTGDVEIKNSAEVNPGGAPGDLMIYSQGDFVLKNSGDI